VGEVHGRITARVEALAHMLSVVDSAKATTNLWGERWSETHHQLHGQRRLAATGLNSKGMVALKRHVDCPFAWPAKLSKSVKPLAAELETIRGMSGENGWRRRLVIQRLEE
jgi:hypothetical protein